MIVNTKTVRTYVVEMTNEQRDHVIQFIKDFEQSDVINITSGFDSSTFETMRDLRESLLNG